MILKKLIKIDLNVFIKAFHLSFTFNFVLTFYEYLSEKINWTIWLMELKEMKYGRNTIEYETNFYKIAKTPTL